MTLFADRAGLELAARVPLGRCDVLLVEEVPVDRRVVVAERHHPLVLGGELPLGFDRVVEGLGRAGHEDGGIRKVGRALEDDRDLGAQHVLDFVERQVARADPAGSIGRSECAA